MISSPTVVSFKLSSETFGHRIMNQIELGGDFACMRINFVPFIASLPLTPCHKNMNEQ